MKYQLMDSLALKFDVRHLINFNHGDNTMLYTLGLAVPFGERTQMILDFDLANRINQILKEWIKKK
jgi:hypothetical protein